jgi:hypothetical protein
VDAKGRAPVFENDGVRAGVRIWYDTCVYYEVQGNFNQKTGTVMMWFKPAWGADLDHRYGRILWDLRIDHGSVVPQDPSQRYALTWTSPKGKYPRRWRFCISTNRNLYIIGKKQRRPDRRTRQAVFGTIQDFPANRWMHLAVAWKRNEGRIYIDGHLDQQSDLPEGLPDKTLPKMMQIGALPSYINAGAEGVISDFRIYDRVLDAREIRSVVGIQQ